MKTFIACAVGALLLTTPALALDMTGVTTCSLHGFSTDTDPAGTNVRAAPDKDAPILGQLPPQQNAEGAGAVGVVLEIVGSKNGWLLIHSASSGDPSVDAVTPVFKKPGWISGDLVGFIVGSSELLDAPNPGGNVVATLQNTAKGIGPDSYTVKKVNGCNGKFADITVQLPASIKPNAPELRGWASKVCGNQVATCDPY